MPSQGENMLLQDPGTLHVSILHARSYKQPFHGASLMHVAVRQAKGAAGQGEGMAKEAADRGEGIAHEAADRGADMTKEAAGKVPARVPGAHMRQCRRRHVCMLWDLRLAKCSAVTKQLQELFRGTRVSLHAAPSSSC